MVAGNGAAGRRRGRRGRVVALAVALYVACGVLATSPAIVHANERYLGFPRDGHGEVPRGDHLQLVWSFWLPGHQIERFAAPWRDPYTFQPEASANPNTLGWLLGLPFWPLERIFGPVVAYNAIVLASFVLAGCFAAAWLGALGLGRGPAFLGGMVYALAPYRVAQSTGHLLALIAFLLPASLLALERRRFALAALALTAIPLSGQLQLALAAIPLFVGYGLVRLRDRADRLRMLAGALTAVAAGILVRQAVVSGSIAAEGRSLDDVSSYAAAPADFVRRSLDHGLERFVFLGWLTPLVAMAGFAVLLRGRRRGLALVLGLAAVVPALLALGTNLPLDVYQGLWHAFPPIRFSRVPSRTMLVACLAVAALVAFAVRAAPRRAWVVPVVALALVADLRVQVFDDLDAGLGNAAYAAVRDDGALLELPVYTPDTGTLSVYYAYALQSPRDRPLGYSTTAPPAALRFAREHAALSCGRGAIPGDVRFVAVHRGLYVRNPLYPEDCADRAEDMLRARGWTPLARDGLVSTWENRG